MNRIFITSTNTGIGKTYVTQLLMHAFADRNYRVGVMKPIETGVDPVPEDAASHLALCQMLNPDFRELTLSDICPWQFRLPAAPAVANKGIPIHFDQLEEKIHKLAPFCDILLIEGAGGIMVPVDQDRFMIDLISRFSDKALLVTPSRLGCINDTLLSQMALKERNIPFEWCVNLHEEKESFFSITWPYYEQAFEEVFLLPEKTDALTERLIS